PLRRRLPSRGAGPRPAGLRLHPRLAPLHDPGLRTALPPRPVVVRRGRPGREWRREGLALRPSTGVDVAVLGARPSGCAAALRLLALGHRVALIERLPFPRRQIGESISPGVWAILDFLEANATLVEAAHLKDVPARVAWEDREPTLITPSARGPGVMVDRGDF